jgi:hypothetical protein
MATPTRYTRATSFSGYQATNPNRPLPGPSLDNELSNIETSVNEAISAIGDIRRDDGQLRNGIVGRDALAPDLATGVSPATLWQAGLVYQEQDTVSYLTAFYRCVISHTSDAVFTTDLGAGRWVLYSEIGTLATDAEAARDAAIAAAATAVPAAAAASVSQAAALASQNAAAASATAANNVVTSGTVGAVRHDVVQTLTAPQQTQARANLGGAALAGASAQTFLVAAATVADHAVSRVFGDGRYDRITTSPTALAAGATIPSTENGRAYSLALPTAQTCALPLTAGLPDGFSCVVRITGSPSAYQSAFVNGNGKTIYYRGNNLALFFLVGAGEIFRFTWLSGMDLWVAECLAQPQLGMTGNTASNVNTWNTTPTAWVPIASYSGNNNLFATIFQFNSNCIQVAAAGLYHMLGYAQFSSGAGGGVTGTGYIAGGTNGGADTARGFSQHIFNTADGDGATLQVSWTEALQPGDLRMGWFLSSASGLYTFLSGNYFIIRLIGR